MRQRFVCLAGCAAVFWAIVSSLPAQERGPQPPPEGGRRMRGGPPGAGQAAPFQAATVPKDDAEKKILDCLEEINRTQGRMMNVPAADGRLLRLLAETTGAKTVVEIGTSNGISAIWISMGLRKTGGKLITHELDQGRAALARENFVKAGVADIVTVVEGNAHETLSRLKGPVDMVFIDAEKEGYLDYLEQVLPLVRPGGLVLAHNMTARMARADFAEAIRTDPNLETILYMQGGGMSVSLKKM
ncbi:MAG: O-methyltransferase [Pirellulales bacterium]|nr:O-methyltransferase [Pirellulales bacterium]